MVSAVRRKPLVSAQIVPSTREELTDKYIDWLIEQIPGFDPDLQSEGYGFDYDKAREALLFFPEQLCYPKGPKAGKPFLLMVWEGAVVANLFGWIGADGYRRFKTVFLYVGKKNGKTAFESGVMLYVFGKSGLGAELYSAASGVKQARLVFEAAMIMVKKNPRLWSKKGGCLTIYGAKAGSQNKAIEYEEMNSVYRVLAADADAVDGVNPVFNAIDEYHRHKSPELANVLRTSSAEQPEAIDFITTTADTNRESPCNDMRDYALKVRDNPGDSSPGAVGWNPSFMPCIWEPDPTKEHDIEDPKTWEAANPGLGVTANYDDLAQKAREAMESASMLADFTRLHCNIITDSAVAWFVAKKWDACKGELAFRKLEAALEGRECFGGMDLASVSDLIAFVLVFRDFPTEGSYAALTYAWATEESARLRDIKQKAPSYTRWAKAGHLVSLHEGDTYRYSEIRRFITDVLGKRYKIREIGYDGWEATETAQLLEGEGITMVKWAQQYSQLNAPSKELERLVKSRKLVHGGHPVLQWCARNVMLDMHEGRIKPSKKKSADKIDAISALVMGLGGAMIAPLAQDLNELYSSGEILEA